MEKTDKLLSTVCLRETIHQRLTSNRLAQLLPGLEVHQEPENLDKPDEPEPDALPRNDVEVTDAEMMLRLEKLRLDPPSNRFFGKSR